MPSFVVAAVEFDGLLLLCRDVPRQEDGSLGLIQWVEAGWPHAGPLSAAPCVADERIREETRRLNDSVCYGIEQPGVVDRVTDLRFIRRPFNVNCLPELLELCAGCCVAAFKDANDDLPGNICTHSKLGIEVVDK